MLTLLHKLASDMPRGVPSTTVPEILLSLFASRAARIIQRNP